MRGKRLLVLLTYNEIEALPKIFDRLPLSAADEVMAIDGGSKDGTVEFLESKGLKVVPQPRRGRGVAFRLALELTGAETICYYSPDGNEDPEDIPRIFEKIEADGSDLVVASRMMKGAYNEEDVHWFRPRKWVNQLFTLAANLLWNRGLYVEDTINGFRAVRAESLRRCACDADGFPIEYQMSIRMMKLGMAIGEMPTHEYPRLGGQSTAESWPTGVVFVKTLLREISMGRAVTAADGEKVESTPHG
ncbi:MAG: glycosyltransferase family 2 protein [Elusimicrobiota bacterium]|nr:glycosyltransferase family 2 protein [Elusimicrobiota bacterium]